MMPGNGWLRLVTIVHDQKRSWIPVLFLKRVKAKIAKGLEHWSGMSTWLPPIVKNWWLRGKLLSTGIPPTAATPLMATTKAKPGSFDVH